MNAYATIEVLSHTTIINGRKTLQAVVELTSAAGQWLGVFKVFGFTVQQLKDTAYMQADANLENKGYTLQSLREYTA